MRLFFSFDFGLRFDPDAISHTLWDSFWKYWLCKLCELAVKAQSLVFSNLLGSSNGWNAIFCWLNFTWRLFLFSYLIIYINKNEPRCRVTTMPLLTTLWVSLLVLFQHHVTSVPQSAGWVGVTWPRRGQSSGRTSPLVPEHAVVSSSSSNLNTQSAAAHFTFLTNQRFTFPNVYTTNHQQQPSANQ